MSKINNAYQYLLQIRDLDNQLTWTRSNIILIVHGGLWPGLFIAFTRYSNWVALGWFAFIEYPGAYA